MVRLLVSTPILFNFLSLKSKQTSQVDTCNASRYHSDAPSERSSMTTKCRKRWYLTSADAEKERQRLIATATDKPRAKQLVVYCCRDCNLFHVGHLRRRFADMPKLTPAPAPQKPPTGRTVTSRRRKARERQRTYSAPRIT